MRGLGEYQITQIVQRVDRVLMRPLGCAQSNAAAEAPVARLVGERGGMRRLCGEPKGALGFVLEQPAL